mmetsp:Transcript_16661/g.37465  ORF Transcript_16661/g.37465 Transcript_16661/m.37465 type:complete len:222 (-) Transcript_16661:1097-1762(-)
MTFLFFHSVFLIIFTWQVWKGWFIHWLFYWLFYWGTGRTSTKASYFKCHNIRGRTNGIYINACCSDCSTNITIGVGMDSIFNKIPWTYFVGGSLCMPKISTITTVYSLLQLKFTICWQQRHSVMHSILGPSFLARIASIMFTNIIINMKNGKSTLRHFLIVFFWLSVFNEKIFVWSEVFCYFKHICVRLGISSRVFTIFCNKCGSDPSKEGSFPCTEVRRV